MESITCEIEILTPMFIGGAPQTLINGEPGKAICELRAQSIKGLLRFWWRAYKYGQITGIHDVELMLQKLQKEEGNIFGSVSGGGTKSSFAISISPKHLDISSQPLPNQASHKVPVKGKTFSTNILEYLCYGTYEYVKGQGNKFIREYLKENQVFNLKLRFDNQDYREDILTALYLFSEFGGIGSRSRNGFGSFMVQNKDEVFGALGDGFLKNIISNKDFLNRLKVSDEIPPFTAFSSGIKLFTTFKKDYRSWDLCLADLGKVYRSCREELEPRHHYEKRQYIGAPLDPPQEHSKSILERHSKPYFLKVTKVGSSVYCGSILFIPSFYVYNEYETKDKTRPPFNRARDNIQFQQTCMLFNALLTKDKGLEAIL
ncbi:MAG: type III-B CRISPR module RAMP protein Cmr1 [Syntrophus sp. (in: bacteria)]|nr:type III-B CRISPR module RAMP protein Cmr1 [Syntrophus sp. (in: bacteria)]